MKGAASTLYGNAAATAVIRITTKNASREGSSLTLSSVAGTDRAQDGAEYGLNAFTQTVLATQRMGDFGLTANWSNQYNDGMSAAIGEETDRFSRNNLRLGATLIRSRLALRGQHVLR